MFSLDFEFVRARVCCVCACQVQVTSLCAAVLFFRRQNQTKSMQSFKRVFVVSSWSPSHRRCAPREKVHLTSNLFDSRFYLAVWESLVSPAVLTYTSVSPQSVNAIGFTFVTWRRIHSNHWRHFVIRPNFLHALVRPPVDLPPHCVKVSKVCPLVFELY